MSVSISVQRCPGLEMTAPQTPGHADGSPSGKKRFENLSFGLSAGDAAGGFGTPEQHTPPNTARRTSISTGASTGDRGKRRSTASMFASLDATRMQATPQPAQTAMSEARGSKGTQLATSRAASGARISTPPTPSQFARATAEAQARSSSEGSLGRITRRSSGGRAQVQPGPRPFVWLDERRSSVVSARPTVFEESTSYPRAPSPVTPRSQGVGAAKIQSMQEAWSMTTGDSSDNSPQSRRDCEIYQEVSSLVDELEAARARALATGGHLPRAIEAAATALEPLLRLRDVTGAFQCDLSLMPWLPQLLAVFRNVLRTAVDGVGVSPLRPGGGMPTMCADSGAGSGTHGAAAAAAAAAAAMAALGTAGCTTLHGGSYVEEKLRARAKHQEQALEESRMRELRLRQDLQDLQRDHQALLHRVVELERRRPHSYNEEAKSMADTKEASWLTRRVSELERENDSWREERRTAEEQIGELVRTVAAAVET